MVVATSMNDYREDFAGQGVTPTFRAASRAQMMDAVNQVFVFHKNTNDRTCDILCFLFSGYEREDVA